MKKNTLYLIGGIIALYFLLRKKSVSGVGDPGYLVAESGAMLQDMPYGMAPLYNFKGGEKLKFISDLGDTVLVEFTTMSGNTIRGQVGKSDIVNIK